MVAIYTIIAVPKRSVNDDDYLLRSVASSSKYLLLTCCPIDLPYTQLFRIGLRTFNVYY
jgi:hypothetical protein